MKCLLCNDWIESLPKLRELIMFNQRKEYSCRSCKHQFKNLSKERCQNCNKELYGDACIDCKLWMKKGYIPKHLAIYRYEENMKEYFSRYKFDGDYLLRKVFSDILQKELKKYKDYQIVIVPLSGQRFNSRGFNQVEGLIKDTGLSYLDILIKNEVEASSSKNRADRLLTVFPFLLKDGVKLPENILLFDDIYTTGTTLNRLKSMLLEAGCQNIKTFSLAR